MPPRPLWGGPRLTTHQALLDEQAEEDGVAHLAQVLEAHGLQLRVLHDVLQLVMEELQDACAADSEWRLGGRERGRAPEAAGRGPGLGAPVLATRHADAATMSAIELATRPQTLTSSLQRWLVQRLRSGPQLCQPASSEEAAPCQGQ